MKSQTNSKSLPRRLVRSGLETVLFGASLALLIPPVPSDEETRYTMFPVGWLAVICFASFRALAIQRKAENIPAAVVQTMIFTLYGFLIFYRVSIR